MDDKNTLNDIGGKLDFKKLDFTTNYFDKEGDLPYEVTILNDVSYGALLYNNKIVKAPFIFNINNVDKFQYMRVSPLEYTEEINFKTSDNNLNKLYSEMATMTINVSAKVNEPPIIGDNEVDIEYDATYIFTQDDFTTNTTPPYNDPEGNPPYKLKILSLPLTGTFLFNNTSISVNQEILFTDINAGLLRILGSKADINGETLNFTFTISDTGSQIYA